MTLEAIYTAILSGTAFVSIGLATTLYRTDIVADTVPFKILKRSKILAGNIAMVTALLSVILLHGDSDEGRSVGLICVMMSAFYTMGIMWCWMVIPLIAPDFLTKEKVIRDIVIFAVTVISANVITTLFDIKNPAICLLFAGVFLTHCGSWVITFGKLYRRAMFNLEENYSDYIFLYIDWTYDASLAIIVFTLSGVLLCYADKITIAVFFLFAALAYCYVVQSLNRYQIHAERLYLGLKRSEEETKTKSSDENSKKETKSEIGQTISQPTADYKDSDDKKALDEESPIGQRMRKWIEEEGYLQPGLTLNDIADKIGTNRTYVSRFINTTYNSTFFEFIANLRIEKIKALLTADPDSELEYLSSACGFSSSSHMSSTFKKITGETPLEFRSKIKRSRGED